MYVYSSQCGGDPGDIGPTIGEQLKRDPFGTVIQSNVLSSMCLSITSQEDPYNRLWCVYELNEALNRQEELHKQADKAVEEGRGNLEVEKLRQKAEAFIMV